MQISTSSRAGQPEVEFSMTPDEQRALFGPHAQDSRVMVKGDARQGLTLMPTTETTRDTKQVKSLDLSRRNEYSGRFWVRCKQIGIRNEKLGRLKIAPLEVKEGRYIRLPPILESWWDPATLGAIAPAPPAPEPEPPAPEPVPLVNGVAIAPAPPAPEFDPHAIGGGKNNFGRLLGLVRTANQTIKLCTEAGIRCWFIVDAEGKLGIQREYKPE